jgi:uncharacterized protein (TIRG00374 family)
LKSRLKILASLTVGALFVYWFAHKLNWGEVWTEVRKANLILLGSAFSLIVGTYFVRVLRWRTLIGSMAEPSLRALFRATVMGFAALFAMGRAGEMIVRPAALSVKERIHPSASYATVMIERVFDMVMVVLLFAINLIFFEHVALNAEDSRLFGWIQAIGVILLLVAAAGVYGLSVFRSRRDGVLSYLDNKLKFLPSPLARGLMSLLRHISEGLSVLHDARELTITVSYTVLLWLMVATAHLLVVRAFGLDSLKVTFSGAVFVMGLSMLGSVVPTPGGATGPFHTATAAALTFLGAVQTKEQAASIAITLHLVIFSPAILFGLVYIIKDSLSLGRLLGRSRPEADSFNISPQEQDQSEEPVAV